MYSSIRAFRQPKRAGEVKRPAQHCMRGRVRQDGSAGDLHTFPADSRQATQEKPPRKRAELRRATLAHPWSERGGSRQDCLLAEPNYRQRAAWGADGGWLAG